MEQEYQQDGQTPQAFELWQVIRLVSDARLEIDLLNQATSFICCEGS